MNRFNIYFMLAVALTLVCGCKTEASKRKKVLSTFRLHQEVNPDLNGRSQQVPIYRQNPITLTVSTAPFLTESNIKAAQVVDVLGGFVIHIQFDRQGTWLLEQYTAASRSKHIAVFSQFTEKGAEKLNKGRWLAAPKVQTHITDGLFVFTPDATHEEAEQIVLGLNNVAAKTHADETSNW
ncbi:MAG TPA: hypothetical protein VNZ22_05170 [Bacillota bacterium]|nr:hypothetical protein [Bacillota bacterium]